MEDQVPYTWVGQRVEAGIVEMEGRDRYGIARGLSEQYHTGTLETVNDLGIVALWVLDSEDEAEEPTSTFYPWPAVLWLRLEE